MPIEDTLQSRINQIRAIIFDLHHTITKTRTDIISFCRETSGRAGVDLSNISDDEINAAFQASNEILKKYVSENDVGIHWGNDPNDWTEINRTFFLDLGFDNVTDEQILQFELGWREVGELSFEKIIDGAKRTFEELHNRGYTLGICSRRQTNPEPLLKEWGISHLLSSIQYSGTPGYAKPNPFTLLKSAEEINVNPRLCAYVGNLVNADVEASMRAEMFPILTIWADSEEKKQAPDGIMIIERITDLLDHFKKAPM